MRHAAHNPLPHVPGPQEASAAGGQTLHLTAFIANQVCVLLGIASFIFLANNKQKADLSCISAEALLELRGRRCDLNPCRQGQEREPDLCCLCPEHQCLELQCEGRGSTTLPAAVNRSSTSAALHESVCTWCDLSILPRSDL